jgi:phytoene dehydrogenase-like protein
MKEKKEIKEYDVVVVGGGIAGLSLAAILSHEGFSCIVLEQLPIAGGRARVVEKNDFIIDYGIHVHRFAGEGRAAEALRKAGIARRFLPVGAPLIRHNGKFIKFPKSPVDILTTPLLSIPSRIKLLSIFIKVLTGKSDQSLYGKTVREWLNEQGVTSPDLIAVTQLISMAGLVCGDIDRASAGELVEFLKAGIRAKEATGYFLGGWDNVIEQLMRVIEKNGEVRTSCKVEKIIVEQGVPLGALTADGEVRGRCTVVNMPLQQVDKVIGAEHFDPAVWERMRNLEPTAGLSLDFCLSKRVTDVDGVIFTMDPGTMGVITSNVEPSMAPRGKQLGTWYYPIPASKMGDKTFLKEERARLREIIAEMFPGIWDHLEYERFIAMDVVDGAVPVVGQTWTERPGIAASRLHRLFFVGDTIGVPGQGGDIAFHAATAAANKIKEILKPL